MKKKIIHFWKWVCTYEINIKPKPPKFWERLSRKEKISMKIGISVLVVYLLMTVVIAIDEELSLTPADRQQRTEMKKLERELARLEAQHSTSKSSPSRLEKKLEKARQKDIETLQRIGRVDLTDKEALELYRALGR